MQNEQSQSNQSQTIGQYTFGKTLGQGTFGKVKQARHIPTGEKVAIKILEKAKIRNAGDVERVSREIKILKTIRHPYLIQLFEIIESQRHLYLITEYASGGELFNEIVSNKRLTESKASKYLWQLLASVEYLHKAGVVHRDLKPENVLINHDGNIKLVDFGLSNMYTSIQTLKTACGSPWYAAPEMIAGKRYRPIMVDVWSCGIILYAMVCGTLPFEDKKTKILYKKILAGEFKIPKYLSTEVRDLLKGILNTNPDQRWTIEMIRSHKWFKSTNQGNPQGILIKKQPIPVDENMLELTDGRNDKIRHYIQNNKHNETTTQYYLILNKYIREGGKSPADMMNVSSIPEADTLPLFVPRPPTKHKARLNSTQIVESDKGNPRYRRFIDHTRRIESMDITQRVKSRMEPRGNMTGNIRYSRTQISPRIMTQSTSPTPRNMVRRGLLQVQKTGVNRLSPVQRASIGSRAAAQRVRTPSTNLVNTLDVTGIYIGSGNASVRLTPKLHTAYIKV